MDINTMYRRLGLSWASPHKLEYWKRDNNPCPGWCNHKHPHREWLFEKYVKLGSGAHRLYWRLHPEEKYE